MTPPPACGVPGIPIPAPLPCRGWGVGTAASRVGVGCEWGGPGFWVGKVCVGVNPTGADTITPPQAHQAVPTPTPPAAFFPTAPPPPP